ncbi:MAG: flagellar export chaperone FliS [Dehalococcoidia bacterium]|nr:flagellar export chaperone FliS [Dehalococcoidia bacterium]
MTTTPSTYAAYRTTTITTADPVTLTTMLFDGALKAMRRARMRFEEGKRKEFLDELERASLIVGELLATLDFERGGDLAKNLSAIYAYCLRRLTEATLGELDKLAEAEKHVGRIAEAWKQAVALYRAGQAEGNRAA